MRIRLYQLLCFAFCLIGIIQQGHSAENVYSSMENTSKKYKHINVQDQITAYRTIFNNFFEKMKTEAEVRPVIYKNVNKEHIDGIFHILQNGFNLIEDFIASAPTENVFKNEAASLLETIKRVSQKIENEKKLGMDAFININLILAIIADHLKGQDETSRNQMKIQQFIGVTSKMMMSWGDENIERLIFRKNKKCKREYSIKAFPYNIFYPRIFIYTQTSARAISPNTFVQEALHKDYGVDLLLFFVGSQEYRTSKTTDKVGTKKDPHYSQFNGTFSLLLHDIAHANEQCAIEEDAIINGDFNLIKTLKIIREYSIMLMAKHNILEEHLNNIKYKYEIANRSDDPSLEEWKQSRNQAKVLRDGLFILSHEFLNSVINYQYIFKKNWYLIKKISDPKEKFIKLISLVKADMINHAQSNRKGDAFFMGRLMGYKTDHRDHEYILQNDLVKSNRRTVTMSPEDKQVVVQEEYNNFWDTFIALIEDLSFRKAE